MPCDTLTENAGACMHAGYDSKHVPAQKDWLTQTVVV